ncbi:MAG TPA: rod shape-determining protein MreD, partial [Pirellulales bacterium]
MTNLLAFFCGTYLVAIAETVLAQWLDIRRATPSLLALWAIVWVASRKSPPRRASQMGIAAAGFIGLVFDLNSGGRVGVGVLAFAAVAFVIEQNGPRFRRLDPLLRTLATAPLVAVAMLLVLLGNLIAGESLPPLPLALANVLMIAVYTACVSLPIWMAAAWLIEPARGKKA